ncbi:MAG: ABC transporter substrate-binding protein [Pseudomonadota bacterium]
MKITRIMQAITMAGLVAAGTASVQAEEVIKVGMIAPFSGAFAHYGKQMENGMKAYMKLHGDTVAGKKIEILLRDTTGPVPQLAKRLAQELVVRDKVHFMVGFGFTPEALAVAPVAQAAKVPMIVMNAAAAGLTGKSDYMVRVAQSLQTVASPMAAWALKNNIRKVVTLVSDYSPGIDSETAFINTFTAGGGQVLEKLRVPVTSPDFAPYIQRIKDAKPDAMFVFLPGAEQGMSMLKSYRGRGLEEAGIKLIAVGNLTDDHTLPSMGNDALGIITSFHYSIAHKSPENTAFLKAYADANPGAGRADYLALGGYDGMAAVYEVVRKLNGNVDGEKSIAVLKGMKLNSPRGPVTIDARSGDMVQNIYIRRVEKVAGELMNVEFEKFNSADFEKSAKP